MLFRSEEHGVFPSRLIDGLIKYLKKFNDANLRNSVKDNEKEIMKLVNAYLHCG